MDKDSSQSYEVCWAQASDASLSGAQGKVLLPSNISFNNIIINKMTISISIVVIIIIPLADEQGQYFSDFCPCSLGRLLLHWVGLGVCTTGYLENSNNQNSEMTMSK